MNMKKIIMPLLSFTLLSYATVYEDAEDGSTDGWRVLSKKGATVNNVELDANRVIEFSGKKNRSFILGGKNHETDYQWNDASELKTLSWKMNFDRKYKLSVYVETTNKKVRKIVYTSKRKSKKTKKAVVIGLGKASAAGEWVNIERDLEADLQSFFPNDEIIAVNGVKVKGKGLIDDIIYGNESEVDIIKPVITLLGNDNLNLVVGDSYEDEGATASDNVDGDLSENIEVFSTVDITVEGSYTITYNVIDNAGNSADEVTRTVVVTEAEDITAPVFTSSSTVTVAENQTSAITLVATDDRSSVSYTIDNIVDFDVNSATGVVTFKVAPDYEELDVYTFTATATDSSGNEATQEVTVSIDNTLDTVITRFDSLEPATCVGYIEKSGLDTNGNGLLDDDEVTEVQSPYYANGTPLTREELDTMILNLDDVTVVNTCAITDMSQLFIFNNTFNQDISNWNTSSVTDMSEMFVFASAFNQDIGNWNVSSVRDMSEMFVFANSFNKNISVWNTSSVISMNGMFAETSFNQDISNWTVSSVTTMQAMFSGAVDFNQDLSTWDVTNVSNYVDFAIGSAMETTPSYLPNFL